MDASSMITPDQWASRLEGLGLAVRRAIRDARHERGTGDWRHVIAREGGDEIFGMDRVVERVIAETIAGWVPETGPLTLVAEGFGRDGMRILGTEEPASSKYWLIVDPIDGTRCLMFDKRPAWFIAAVAETPEGGRVPHLGDAFAAVLVELPTTKQGFADSFAAVRGRGCRGKRMHLESGRGEGLSFSPDTTCDLLHRFANVVSLFPAAKVAAARLAEHLAASVGSTSEAAVFDDQYPSTAGQMVELMTGRDAFCCDLRPLFFQLPESQAGLPCHPYDVAGALAAEEAGVILTDGFGRPLAPPLDVFHPVHWCGYANRELQQRVEPIVRQWLEAQGLRP